MKIAGLQKVSLIDFPGHIAATVFLAGCNLNCGFCYNRWMIAESAVTEALSASDLLNWLHTRIGKLDGVCLSGGEPLLNQELPGFINSIRELGYAVKLDTNGTLPKRLSELLSQGLLDYVAMDLKAPFTQRYSQVTGCALEITSIHESMLYLRRTNVSYEYRTTVCPGLTRDDLYALANEIEPYEKWYLQPFKAVDTVDEVWRKLPTMDIAEMKLVVDEIRARLPNARVRGESFT